MGETGREWHLITGEYPPHPGGVADYTAVVAAGLAASGCEVHVWCPPLPGPPPSADGATVHQVRGGFGPRGLVELDRALGAFRGPRTLLVQYVYAAFGLKGMNVPFCAWLLARRALHEDDVRVMFHEPYYPFQREGVRRTLLAAVTHLMAGLLLAAANRVYVSVPAWKCLLMRCNWFGRRRTTWLPIPATVPGGPPPPPRGSDSGLTLGHFGTYGSLIRGPLLKMLAAVLEAAPRLRVKLLGGGGQGFADELVAAVPGVVGRITAPGRLTAAEVAAEIRGCDLMLQYYPDGVSSRRTTVMAALANGVPVVTTLGRLTESVWAGAVAFAAADDPDGLAATTVKLLGDPAALRSLGKRGADLYRERFSLDRTLAEVGHGTLLPGRWA